MRSLALLTLLGAGFFNLTHWQGDGNSAVLRVALDRVPEERIVNFGHADAPADALDWMDQERVAHAAAPQTLASSGTAGARSDQPAMRLASRSSAPPLAPDANGILPINFSLPPGVSSEAGGVGVAKQFASEQGVVTDLTIFLIGGSIIEVERNELIAALGRLGAQDKIETLPAPGDSGRLTLERVRTAGLDLRYDAVRDRLVLRP